MFSVNECAALRACEVPSMKFIQILVASVALMADSTAAVAFDQQQGAAPMAAPQANPAGVAAGGTQFSTDGIDSAAKGTEVRIPGLGKLGVLPKMDFGLELLYGASEPRVENTQPETTSPDGDLRIRGTVKHRF